MSLYDELGVRPTATQGEIRRAYVELARRHHPDLGGSAARMRAINEAWSVLGDPRRRQAYDRDHGARAAFAAPGPDRHGFGDADEGGRRIRLDELFEQLAADDPHPMAEPPPRWLAMVPPGLFAAAIAATMVGIVVADSWILGFGLVLLAVSVVSVAAVTLLTMKSSIRTRRR